MLEPVAIDGRDVRADVGIFRNVARIPVADLDIDVFVSKTFDQRRHLRICAIDQRDHLQQLVKGDWNRRRLRCEVLH
jgi:hypothetical protein